MPGVELGTRVEPVVGLGVRERVVLLGGVLVGLGLRASSRSPRRPRPPRRLPRGRGDRPDDAGAADVPRCSMLVEVGEGDELLRSCHRIPAACCSDIAVLLAEGPREDGERAVEPGLHGALRDPELRGDVARPAGRRGSAAPRPHVGPRAARAAPRPPRGAPRGPGGRPGAPASGRTLPKLRSLRNRLRCRFNAVVRSHASWLSAAGEAVPRGGRPDERLLHEVLGLRRVAHHAVHLDDEAPVRRGEHVGEHGVAAGDAWSEDRAPAVPPAPSRTSWPP